VIWDGEFRAKSLRRPFPNNKIAAICPACALHNGIVLGQTLGPDLPSEAVLIIELEDSSPNLEREKRAIRWLEYF
jgi:hypothetical protein